MRRLLAFLIFPIALAIVLWKLMDDDGKLAWDIGLFLIPVLAAYLIFV